MKIVLVAVPLINTRVAPLSLALLAGQMKAQGYDVKAIDLNIETYTQSPPELKEYWTYYKGFQWLDTSHFNDFIYPNIIEKNLGRWCQRILAESPDVVGISMTVAPAGRALAECLRRIAPEIKIVIGGPSCTKIFNDVEKTPGAYYDAVVHNEGEVTLTELMKSLRKTGRFEPTPGASVLGKNGDVQFIGLREPLMNLDELACPDFDDFDLDAYVDADHPETRYREIPYYTSRGCPARCNFCMDYKMWDVKYRQKSPKKILEEMEYLSDRYGTKSFMLIELIFNGHNPTMKTLANELSARDRGYSFWGHGRIDPRLDIETLELLQRAGFKYFIFGLESGSNNVLKLMRKGYSAETASRILRNVREVGIGCSVNIVAGFPGETVNDYFETVRFVLDHRDCISGLPGICECNATSGTDIYLYPEKFGIALEPGQQQPHFAYWKSVDGKNTYERRIRRKEAMLKIFKQIKFG